MNPNPLGRDRAESSEERRPAVLPMGTPWVPGRPPSHAAALPKVGAWLAVAVCPKK